MVFSRTDFFPLLHMVFLLMDEIKLGRSLSCCNSACKLQRGLSCCSSACSASWFLKSCGFIEDTSNEQILTVPLKFSPQCLFTNVYMGRVCVCVCTYVHVCIYGGKGKGQKKMHISLAVIDTRKEISRQLLHSCIVLFSKSQEYCTRQLLNYRNDLQLEKCLHQNCQLRGKNNK